MTMPLIGPAIRVKCFALLAIVAAAGCTSVPASRGRADLDQALVKRGLPAPAWPTATGQVADDAATVEELLHEPLTVERAVQVAFLRNPRIREVYAGLGLAQANVLDASRIGNPRFGYSDLEASGAGGSRITRSLTLGFADVLLLPARARLARGEFERVREQLGAALVKLATQVETAWYEYASAQQVAEMREEVTRAGESSAEFAQRLRDAGNITPRSLSLELASASALRVATARAKADALRARTDLAEILGISSRESWQVPARLPVPLQGESLQTSLQDEALTARLDVVAARRQVALLEDSLGVTRRWRWLGSVDVGYERENESDGERFHGPSLDFELPLFNQNQGGVLRAQAELEAGRARLAALELGVRNEVTLRLDRLAAAREIAETYRTALVPQREAVVTRTQEEFNYMLTDAFELLQAKREQFDAYQEYLQAVRDYWLERAELRRAVGGRLPGDESRPQPTIGVDALLAPGSPVRDTMRSESPAAEHDHGEQR